MSIASNGYNIYTSSLTNKHKLKTAFFVDSKVNHFVTNFTPINKRLRILRIKGRFFNYSLINILAPTNDWEEDQSKINSKNSWTERTLLARRMT
jgi:hypothetical protein